VAEKKVYWEWQPSLIDPEIVFLRFPGWLFDATDEHIILRIRLLGPKERDEIEAFMLPLDFAFPKKRLISLSLVDENGNRIISEEDEEDEEGIDSPTAIFTLAGAILEANGMLPPPDQNIDLEQHYVPLRDLLLKENPSWPQEKIDRRLVEFFEHLRFDQPILFFQRSYAHKYRPGTTARDLLLSALPQVKDDERLAAAERFIGNRSPMHKGRITEHRAAIWNDLGITSFQEEKKAIKQLGIESLFPSVTRMREALGIFAPEDEMIRTVRTELNNEATFNALPREAHEKGAWRKKPTPDDPELRRRHEETKAYQLEDEGIKGIPPPSHGGPEDDFHDDERMGFPFAPASGLEIPLIEEEAAIAARDDLQRKLRSLTPKQRRYLNAWVAAGGDMDRAAKKLKIKPGTLKGTIYRIKLKNNPKM
jgi:DNA-binding CsgD family transcriptional regulator